MSTSKKSPRLTALLFALTIAHATAATFVVSNNEDSGLGSLRQAITDANASAGLDTIAFNIPGTGVHTITVLSVFPDISSPVLIDGYTQPGSAPNTLADGNNAKLLIEIASAPPPIFVGQAFNLNSGPSTVRGLVINRFLNYGILVLQAAGAGNVVQGNFIGTDTAGEMALGNGVGVVFASSGNNQIGGTSPVARNLISGNKSSELAFEQSSGNIVEGNYIGTNAAGTAIIGGEVFKNNNEDGIRLGATSDGNRIGGTSPGARNLISGIQNDALIMRGTIGNVVQGNYIGTDVTGNSVIGNALNTGSAGAVQIIGGRNPFGSGGGPATDNIIGGTAPGAGNVISGYMGSRAAVVLGGASQGSSAEANANLVQGNFIGTNKDGTITLGNRGNGVHVQSGSDNFIGGTVSGAGNVIAHSRNTGADKGAGVLVSAGTGNRILRNSIYDNFLLGIDLLGGPMAVTLNDAGDADTGPNNLQNYPVINSAVISGSAVTITGTLQSTPGIFRVEFFSSAVRHPSGFGEGATFLGASDVTTDASGNGSFKVTFPVSVEPRALTATATDAAGNTSEFSSAFAAGLLNISTRMRVLSGERVLIAGFIITGADPKRVIIRGMGPSLRGSGVPDTLQDPVLDLNLPGPITVTNDNWRDTQAAEIEASGIAPGNDSEAAIVTTLQPGAYTAVLREKNSVPGVGLVEVYDLGSAAGSKLANISTRGFVDTGDNVMIGGFIVGPTGVGPTKVIVRAIGPSLSRSGIQGPLQDPTLQLVNGSGVVIAENDNWKENEAAIIATGLPPSNDAESALVASLAPGNYTAIVRGKDGTKGVGLVEAYNVP